MNRKLFVASTAFLLAAALLPLALDRGARGASAAAAGPDGARILKAAGALLDALGEAARAKALIDFSSEERFRWDFVPRERKGVPLKELSESQRALVGALLRASLSEKGAKLAEAVMSHEAILAEIEGPRARFARDPLLYYVTFFGRPAREGRWGFRVEGHHLSLNFTLDGERVISISPVVFGANPAIVRSGPKKDLRLLGPVEDLAREVVASLGEEDRKACLGEAVPEEVPGTNAARYPGTFPSGITGDRLSPEARMKVLALVREYAGNLPAGAVEEKEIGEDALKEIHVAWRGSLKPFEGHSYLIHSPGFLINYANYQNGAAHIHTAFRMRAGEFGLAPQR